jgi:hypothetical protein
VVFQHEATLPEIGVLAEARYLREDCAMTSSNERPGSEPSSEPGGEAHVAQKPCPDCGFDAGTVAGPQVASLLRAAAARWAAVFERANVGLRPEPQVWSPLEYGCHVRDVCRVFELRANLMRFQGDPAFESWDQDATAVADAYSAQDPAVVSVELSAAAETAAAAFDAVGDREWQRTGRRSDGSVFTVETLGQYFLHDVTHHLHDVRG